MWYQLPVMELAGRIPSKLANKYKLYRVGKLSAAQLAAEIKNKHQLFQMEKHLILPAGH